MALEADLMQSNVSMGVNETCCAKCFVCSRSRKALGKNQSINYDARYHEVQVKAKLQRKYFLEWKKRSFFS